MRDAILLESQGIPSAAIITETFRAITRSQLEALGWAHFRPVVVPHPFGTLTREAVRALAERVGPEVAAWLQGGA
ncbi:MAG: hypothetical protein K6V97_14160 [Actinomycetia bacterium]|nr:hypothetical protein [Actinomycetes bacterium]